MPRDSVADFSHVDRSADTAKFVAYLDEVARWPAIRALKARTMDLLEPRPGNHMLDVGCGTGDDVRALAGRVGPGGLAVGVDRSEIMVAEARRRAEGTGLPVEFRAGDAYALDFPDASFDGCRAERLVVHLAEPDRLVCELARVARPGGRVVLADADWETLVVDPGDPALTRRIIHDACDSAGTGWAGRRLPNLLKDAGLEDVRVEALTSIGDPDFERTNRVHPLRDFAERAAAGGAVTADEAATWIGHLEAASRAGRFFAALTLFIASGRKPVQAVAHAAMADATQ